MALLQRRRPAADPVHTDATPNAPPASAAPATMADVEFELAGLERERKELRATLDSLPGLEQALLEADAEDAAFAGLEVQRKKAVHRLSRIEDEMRRLFVRGQEIEDEGRLAGWGEIRERYAEASRKLHAALRAAGAAHLEAASVAEEARRRGYLTSGGIGFLPAPLRPAAEHEIQTAERLLEAVPMSLAIHRPPPARETVTVRFLRMWEGYSKGVEAGFPAVRAWDLVEKGFAEWLDPVRIPPDPRKAAKAAPPAPPKIVPVQVRFIRDAKMNVGAFRPGTVATLVPADAALAIARGVAQVVGMDPRHDPEAPIIGHVLGAGDVIFVRARMDRQQGMKPVRLLLAYEPIIVHPDRYAPAVGRYNAGMEVDFSAAEAEALVRAGAAIFLGPGVA